MIFFISYRFNRGALLNIGVKLADKYTDYVALHDVDLLPRNNNLLYTYPKQGPFHIAAPGLHPNYNYPSFLGGILLIRTEHFMEARLIVYTTDKKTTLCRDLCFLATRLAPVSLP